MSSLQIRNVPDETVRSLKIRAAAAGMSLSEFALSALTATVARPSLEELSERIRVRGAVEPKTRASDIVNDARRDGAE
ncbi:FitA-like ribbon-helix-helix domain-containing protein [Paramicrobacterium fandaimingii]|uniref:FitA-like ribbon-helix-helix domain-containing protein n=1 Tax=Paramicrobacterium fandaimingii TaxID=2708079 RepID=UPI00141DCB41|nr:hypothetical protein [Microbacterium fandaimingii]